MVECLVQCSESLQLAATNILEPGMEMVTNSHGSQVEMTFVSSATAHPTLDEDGRRELFLQLTLVSPADQVDEKVSDDIRVIS